ncbi:MAG: glycoside hydrolase family 3 C-terminal domain-containing protein [Pontiellaceae bacterium]|nr:glycoside hydrolase family 3 C-terminal domain-containing protein [Pontiellaceae bacterium]MBN2783716.1 glycoside hydrolase family 3 C-terminal domain-containing protein [Pontiellaceae bacterium]
MKTKMRMYTVAVGLLVVLWGMRVHSAPGAIFKDPKVPLEQRVEDLLGRLTQEEKITMLGGVDATWQPIPRLGIPALRMVDGGLGVRGLGVPGKSVEEGGAFQEGPATAFPGAVTMAATWNQELIRRTGEAIAIEAINKGSAGSRILLGPAVNIHRSPMGGRNGEYFTEDPYLAARLAIAYINGVQQDAGIGACIKHFVCNNQETDRGEINVNVSERALREIYFPAFEAAVKEAGVVSVMSSYNGINGRYVTDNAYILTDVLKEDWGFDGVVISDWGAVHATSTVQAGNDVEMPWGNHVNPEMINAALKDGTITQAAIDESVRRMLRTIIRLGLLEGDLPMDHSLVNSDEHRDLAFEIAAEGIVLLKNSRSLLPLNSKKIRNIAVIGECAKHLQFAGLGSPEVHPLRSTSLLDGIATEAPRVNVDYVNTELKHFNMPASWLTPPGKRDRHGFLAEYFSNRDVSGAPVASQIEDEPRISGPGSPAPDVPSEDYSVRWSTELRPDESGYYQLRFSGDDGYRVLLDGKTIIDHWIPSPGDTSSASLELEQGKTYRLEILYFQGGGNALARMEWFSRPNVESSITKAAKAADVTILCVSTMGGEREGQDRVSYDLPGGQERLIRTAVAANPRTIVILNNGTPVAMNDWIEEVPSVIEAWLPGQEGGAALAAILFGRVNPSGKLPDTLAVNRADYSDTPNFPGENHQVDYAEGIYVGYRHFDKAGIQPLFPFGYGLSYTTFDYKEAQLSAPALDADGEVWVAVRVANTGKTEGAEIVQLYVQDPSPMVDRPLRELKGFARVSLKPLETKVVKIRLTPRDLSYYDESARQWTAHAGTYEILVGASSRDIRKTLSLKLENTFTEAVSNFGNR